MSDLQIFFILSGIVLITLAGGYVCFGLIEKLTQQLVNQEPKS
jgi:hypothetical protein